MERFIRILAVAALAGAVIATAAAPAGADFNLGTVDGLTYMQGTTAGPSAPPTAMSSSAACPAGTHVVGGGATPSSGGTVAELWLNRSRPFDGPDSDTRPDDGWAARGYNRFGTTKAFSAFAICFAGGVRYATAQATAPAGTGMSASAQCPGTTHVSGGGATLNGSADAGYLNALNPIDSSDPGTLPDDGWRARGFNRTGLQKRLDVYATCTTFNPQYTSLEVTGGDSLIFDACPAGSHAMEGGVSPSGPAGQAFLNTNYPYAGTTNPPDTGFVTAIRVAGSARPLTFYVICKT
jgi:hypothetical protein